MKALPVMLALAALLAASCANPIYVEHNFADYAQWDQFKTYYWLPLPESDMIVPAPGGGETQLQRMIRVAIEKELNDKGLSRVADSGDLGVRYQLQSQATTEISQNFSLGVPTTRVDQIKTGYLLVQLLDDRGVVMWEGLAEHSARQDATIEARDESLKKAVAKLFKKYPPK